MSISIEGLSAKPYCGKISVLVPQSHPLMQLASSISFQKLYDLIEEDLKNTTVSGYWWLGRKINARSHLGVFILQSLLKETDRAIEQRVKDTPVLQVFCGNGIVQKWSCPDHTKIEKFRNRLSAETQKKIGDYVIKLAIEKGFADPSWMDIDSTVQEANITYPSDAKLMRQLADKCFKVLKYMKEKGEASLPKDLNVDLELIAQKSKDYFFLAKNSCKEKRRKVFSDYHARVKQELKPVIRFIEGLSPNATSNLPWNIQEASKTIAEKGWRYLLDVAHFTRNHTIKPGKILSWHAEEVTCVKKGKVGKDHEFGRVFQLGRMGGNYMVAFTCTDLKMSDKPSLISCLEEYENTFGSKVLKELGADKGYYSQENIKTGESMGVDMDGVQRPANIKTRPEGDHLQRLYNRRAGIEPLIKHVKDFGLQKSRMKSDQATLASGYRSTLGFNLNKLMTDLSTQSMTA